MVIAAPECGMFGGMAVAHVYIPGAPAHLYGLSLLNAGKSQRHRGHDISEVKRPFVGAFGKKKSKYYIKQRFVVMLHNYLHYE